MTIGVSQRDTWKMMKMLDLQVFEEVGLKPEFDFNFVQKTRYALAAEDYIKKNN